MTNEQDTSGREPASNPLKSNWGSILFYGTLVLVLIFFWWLLIESGGVSGHHG